MDFIIFPVKWVPWSWCNSKGILQTGVILSNSNLPTVKAVAVLHGKASTQCEIIQIITKIYSYPWDCGILMKPNCHTSKGPLGMGKWPCDQCSGFLGLYLRQIIHPVYAFLATIEERFEIYSFLHRVIFSGAYWVRECMCWSKGNWAPMGTISLLLFSKLYSWGGIKESCFLLPYFFFIFWG